LLEWRYTTTDVGSVLSLLNAEWMLLAIAFMAEVVEKAIDATTRACSTISVDLFAKGSVFWKSNFLNLARVQVDIQVRLISWFRLDSLRGEPVEGKFSLRYSPATEHTCWSAAS
jgi:hypothetical protein